MSDRSYRVDLFTPAELAIRNAMLELEKVGVDVRLTDASIHLQKAQESSQDFIIEKEKRA